jgi:hypothetical protein
MRAKLSEADEIVARLKATAFVAAKTAYHSLGWQSRMAHPVCEKQALADEMDAFLQSAGVTADQISEVKRPYIRFILFDLDQVLRGAARGALQKQAHLSVQRINALGSDYTNAIVAELNERAKRISEEITRDRPGLKDGDSFNAKLAEGMAPAGLLDENIEEVMRRIKDRIARAGDECSAKGRLTDEGADLIVKGGEKVLAEEFNKAAL